MQNKRIAIVTDAFNRQNGGAAAFVNLYDSLKSKVKELKIFTFRRESYKNIIDLVRLKQFYKINRIKDINALSDFDVVFFHPAIKEIAQLVSIKRCNSKFITFHFANVPKFHENRIFYSHLKSIDNLVFSSIGHLEDYTEQTEYDDSLPQGRLLLPTVNEKILNSIQKSTTELRTINVNSELNFICIGSIQPRKNQKFIIEELIKFSLVTEAKIKIKFYGTFSGIHKNYCKDFKELVNLTKGYKNLEVCYMGHKNNKVVYLDLVESDITILASREEGFATVIRESLCLSKLVITSKLRGNYGVLKHLDNCLEFGLDGKNELLDILKNLQNFNINQIRLNGRQTYLKMLSNYQYEINLRTLIDS